MAIVCFVDHRSKSNFGMKNSRINWSNGRTPGRRPKNGTIPAKTRRMDALALYSLQILIELELGFGFGFD